ncbi:hypothetical protein BD560DRAFT_426065 [Blakeslea trispora]|nr:hypothetical protein BD560DRAFT_426065 [Blakeslea trispora]
MFKPSLIWIVFVRKVVLYFNWLFMLSIAIFYDKFVVPVSSNERISNQEEVLQFIRSWNKSKKKAFKPNVQVKRYIKRRRTTVGEESTKSSRSNRFNSDSE